MTDAFAWLYLPHINSRIEKHPTLFRFGRVNRERMKESYFKSKSQFDSYDDFIEWCILEEKEKHYGKRKN